jgi:hypothetical protein
MQQRRGKSDAAGFLSGGARSTYFDVEATPAASGTHRKGQLELASHDLGTTALCCSSGGRQTVGTPADWRRWAPTGRSAQPSLAASPARGCRGAARESLLEAVRRPPGDGPVAHRVRDTKKEDARTRRRELLAGRALGRVPAQAGRHMRLARAWRSRL